MRAVLKYYRLFNILSLDVAAGAIIASLFLAKFYNVAPSVISMISLGLTVWLIYTADRLLDVRDTQGKAASERHRFHKRNQKRLIYLLLLVITIDMTLIYFMPAIIIKRGMFLSVTVALYILLRRRLHILKEFLIAVLYTAGVATPALPVNQISTQDKLPLFLLFFIALLNLIIFSWYEKENDLNDRQNSIATIMNEKTIRLIVMSLFIVTFSISCYLIFISTEYTMSLVFLLMVIVLFIIFWYKSYFERKDHYRLLGDAIFLIPLIYILS